MNKAKKISKIHEAITQAMQLTSSLEGSQDIIEIKADLKRALNKSSNLLKKEQRKTESMNIHNAWWSNIQTGAVDMANSPMSVEAQMKTLAQLNAMIKIEEDSLSEIETESAEENQLLQG